MERNTPVRKPHTSTADLLTWSEVPPSESPATVSGARSHQVPTFSLFLSLSAEKCTVGFVYIYSLCVCVYVFALILSRPIRSAKSSMEVSSLTKKLRAYWKSKKDSSFLLLFTPKLSLFYFQIIISLHALSLSQFAIRSSPSKFFGQSLFFFVNSWSVL